MQNIKVRIRLYAILRELYGKGEDVITIKENMSVGELLSKLSENNNRFGEFLKERLRSMIILVNGIYATMDYVLSNGDVVDILPPSSGGFDTCIDFRLLNDRDIIDFADLITHAENHAKNHGMGALNIYVGIVKSPINGNTVKELRYEVFREYTLKRFSEIAYSLSKEYQLGCVRILHRVGNLSPGDIALVVVIQSKSRSHVFKAMPKIVDLVKHTTGIWKLEIRDDGAFWVLGEGERVESMQNSDKRF